MYQWRDLRCIGVTTWASTSTSPGSSGTALGHPLAHHFLHLPVYKRVRIQSLYFIDVLISYARRIPGHVPCLVYRGTPVVPLCSGLILISDCSSSDGPRAAPSRTRFIQVCSFRGLIRIQILRAMHRPRVLHHDLAHSYPSHNRKMTSFLSAWTR